MYPIKIRCDGCDRGPTFWEWARAELTMQGYHEWRHPGRVFKEAGLPMTYENRERCALAYQQIFGLEIKDELSYFCPQCQERVLEELPSLIPNLPTTPASPDPGPRPW